RSVGRRPKGSKGRRGRADREFRSERSEARMSEQAARPRRPQRNDEGVSVPFRMLGGMDERICSNCGSPLPADARFCPRCGTPVDAPMGDDGEGSLGPIADVAERKVVTVLFADLARSTELANRLDAERFREVMAAFYPMVQ